MEMRNFEVSERPDVFVGTLLKTEFFDVGFFQKVNIKKVIITDIISDSRHESIRLQTSPEKDHTGFRRRYCRRPTR